MFKSIVVLMAYSAFSACSALSGFSAFAGDEFETGAAVLEGVEGGAPIEVLRAGTWSPVALNVTVQPGESVRTSASAARLVYSDGSAVALSTDTEIKLISGSAREIELAHGTVWGKIEKAGRESPKTTTAHPYKFMLRSTSVVMGVRGTEFLVESGARGEVAVNTLEGTVDTAPDKATLESGHGVPVHRLERIRAQAGTPFGRAEGFRGEDLNARLTKDHAGLVKFLGRPIRNLRPERAAARGARLQVRAVQQQDRAAQRAARRAH